jgi:hypothetical protein
MEWEPFQTVFRATGVSTVTLYINQELTSSSVVADLNVFQLITQSNQPQNYTFSCASKWRGESGSRNLGLGWPNGPGRRDGNVLQSDLKTQPRGVLSTPRSALQY